MYYHPLLKKLINKLSHVTIIKIKLISSMKPVLSYVIRDTTGKIIFDFPPNTLLEKITDVWSIIIDYRNNYYPFLIGIDSNYREVTRDEFKTNKFIKLFYFAYKDKKIKFNIDMFHYRICVDGYPLCINNDQIYTDKYCETFRIYSIGNGGAGFSNIHGDIDKIYVCDSNISGFLNCSDLPLMVLSDIIFD